MTKDEALKLALEALQEVFWSARSEKHDEAITAIKEALAQTEHGWTSERIAGMARFKEAQDKRLAQRTWVGLTPQERDEINEQVYGAVPHHVAFHAAIEAKLKEKNT